MKQPRNKEAQGRNQREQQARNLPPRVSDPQTGFHLRRLLDIHAPSRTYRIDTIGRELFSAGLLPDHRARYERAISADTEDKERSWDDLGISEGNLEFVEPDIRAKVEIYAGVSLDWAYWDLVDLPAMDTEMRQHLDDILEARRILTRLEKLNVELTGLKISRFLGKKGERENGKE